jgi:uncharacterized protein (DUF58 family)
MARYTVDTLLAQLGEAELDGITRVAERLLAGRPLQTPGRRPAQQLAGAGHEFLDYREYVPGDDLRDLDWRASARSQRMQVRRYRDETCSGWYLCLDRSASMQIADGVKWQLAAELTAAMAYVLLNLGNRVGLLLFSDGVDAICPLGRGHAHYVTTLATILSNPPAQEGGASSLHKCVTHMTPGAGAIVLSDFLAPDAMQSGLARIARTNGPVHALLVAAREEFLVDSDGPISMQDVETGQRMTVASGAGVTDQVKNAWLRLQDELRAYCRRRDIPFTAGWSDEPWKTVLLRHLVTLGGHHA